MNDSQSNNLDMYILVNDFYLDNQVTLDLVLARATAFGLLGTNLTAINAQVAGQSTNTTGVTQDKAALRNTLDNITVTVLSSAKVWANVTENNTLAAEFNYSLSDIQEIKDDTMQGFCDFRIQLVTDNLAALADYGIDNNAVTAWQDALDAFVNKVGSPRQAINTRHLHTANLKAIFKATGKLFRDRLDPLMLIFKTTDPELYAAYQQARIVIDRKGKGTGSNTVPANTIEIGAYIYNSETELPIVNALFKVLNPPTADPATATTDEEGKLTLRVSGYMLQQTVMVEVEISATDFETILGQMEMTAGNAYSFDISMMPIPLPVPEP